ncbi:hypothetical protein [Rhodococcus daqingensis]|uniref:SinR family protein n=1 Tax=Rhodococcus daqingensis TaxID=2479363 RepID=A0ABW2RU87_9NOCA
MINYDLSAPGRNYTALTEAIKALGRWSHPVESTWIVSSSLTPAQIRDRLRGKLDSNDKLIVAEMSGAWASTRVSTRVTDWLKTAA